MSEFKTIEPTDKRPDGWPSYCRYSPPDFEKGSRVRIFSSYAGKKTIQVREGVVTNRLRDNAPSLELKVRRSGLLKRDESGIDVLNYTGFLVCGIPELADTRTERTGPYNYENITLAQEKK